MDVTLAIANQITKTVPGATIYRENQEQAFTEPSFYIYEINATSKDEFMDYQRRKHLYCVMWFPDSTRVDPGVREQCETMRSKLLDNFDFIDDLTLKVLGKEAKIEQGVLNFTFKLHYRMQKQTTATQLSGLEQTGGLKYD